MPSRCAVITPCSTACKRILQELLRNATAFTRHCDRAASPTKNYMDSTHNAVRASIMLSESALASAPAYERVWPSRFHTASNELPIPRILCFLGGVILRVLLEDYAQHFRACCREYMAGLHIGTVSLQRAAFGRNSGLFYRINYGNRGLAFDARALPVL